jgi:hypothetical protein
VLVPTQAQQLDRDTTRSSPTPLRQYELIAHTTRYTQQHLYERDAPGSGSHRKYLSLWQVNLARVLGRTGVVAALLGTLLLARIAGIAGIAAFALRPTAAEPMRLRP